MNRIQHLLRLEPGGASDTGKAQKARDNQGYPNCTLTCHVELVSGIGKVGIQKLRLKTAICVKQSSRHKGTLGSQRKLQSIRKNTQIPYKGLEAQYIKVQ
ncbi:hypothetical protein SK128_009297 [Halocaridina rubra]|uniref:Uncharacterized protein n=1 Tax=Halocaridina rubra TaxID=373956 RepID=A0AAN8WH23_HALRR